MSDQTQQAPEGVTRWRKRPVTIEAWQVTADNLLEVGRWCGAPTHSFLEGFVTVPTLEGPLRAKVGDWIVKGGQGEFWPVKGDIFPTLYEPASSAPGTVSVSREDLRAALTVISLYTPPEFRPSIILDRLSAAAGMGES